MSLTLELPAELRTQIERAATARGTDVQTFLMNAARRELQVETPASEDVSRKEAIERGFGFLRGRVGSSNEFLAERHAEGKAEREKDERTLVERNS